MSLKSKDSQKDQKKGLKILGQPWYVQNILYCNQKFKNTYKNDNSDLYWYFGVYKSFLHILSQLFSRTMPINTHHHVHFKDEQTRTQGVLPK